MSRISDQKELIDALKDYTQKMTREEYDTFQIFLKRQKDDEDFDKESFEKLQKLHSKYVIKKDINELMKKYGIK